MRKRPALPPMPFCVRCSESYEGDVCPTCQTLAEIRSSNDDPTYKVYLGFMMVALVVWLIARENYPYLDDRLIFYLFLATLLAPFISGIVGTPRGDASSGVSTSRRAYGWGAFVVAALTFVLVGNGAFDKAPPERMSATVADQDISHFRGGAASYYLVVRPSWRSHRSYETLTVGSATYQQVHIGSTVTFNVHRGYFHLPWYDNVVPADYTTVKYSRDWTGVIQQLWATPDTSKAVAIARTAGLEVTGDAPGLSENGAFQPPADHYFLDFVDPITKAEVLNMSIIVDRFPRPGASPSAPARDPSPNLHKVITPE